MNMESIGDWLRVVGVPPEVVSIGAEADNAWCLLRDDSGADDGQPGWEVFWREQGNRYDWARFSSEHVACHYLFGRLTWSQVARGAVGLLPDPVRPAPAQSGAVQPATSGPDPDDADQTQPRRVQPGAGQPGTGQPHSVRADPGTAVPTNPAQAGPSA